MPKAQIEFSRTAGPLMDRCLLYCDIANKKLLHTGYIRHLRSGGYPDVVWYEGQLYKFWMANSEGVHYRKARVLQVLEEVVQ